MCFYKFGSEPASLTLIVENRLRGLLYWPEAAQSTAFVPAKKKRESIIFRMQSMCNKLFVQPTMETLSVACDQTRAVQKALTSLSPEQRQVIEMAYFSGFSQREIAEKINKPLGTVKTRIRLGMVNLRKTLSSLDKGCVPW